MSEVAAIILAAGRGVRFGPDPKLLALLDGKPLVRHVAEAAVRSAAKPIIAVTGHRADDVEAAIDVLPIQIIRNSLFAEGLSSSLKAGIAASPPEAGAVIVLLGDMPFITANLIDELVSAWQSTGRPAALIPISDGRRGNPVVLSRMLEDAVRGFQAMREPAESCAIIRKWWNGRLKAKPSSRMSTRRTRCAACKPR
jgi:molybdenum cofactor cytidylyltransferase